MKGTVMEILWETHPAVVAHIERTVRARAAEFKWNTKTHIANTELMHCDGWWLLTVTRESPLTEEEKRMFEDLARIRYGE